MSRDDVIEFGENYVLCGNDIEFLSVLRLWGFPEACTEIDWNFSELNWDLKTEIDEIFVPMHVKMRKFPTYYSKIQRITGKEAFL